MPALQGAVRGRGREGAGGGGLYICGTERHESRRIDNQLRGRSGRQGDPGESRFYLSAEDELIRLFAGDRIYKILDRLGPVDEHGEEYPLEAKMLSRTVENAQKKVEQQNFLIRKRVLEYDDVMNEQRRVSTSTGARSSRAATCPMSRARRSARSSSGWSTSTRRARCSRTGTSPGSPTQAAQLWPLERGPRPADAARSDREEIARVLSEDALAAYERREEELGDELMRHLERQILLQIIDNRWREHLYEMDYLREGIHLRGFAQIDPLVAYKNEGFTMFRELMNSIWEEFARVIYHVEVNIEPARLRAGEPEAQPPRASATPGAGPSSPPRWSRPPRSPPPRPPRRRASSVIPVRAWGGNGGASENPETVVKADRDKIGRNDPCWCGSGKKYKKCHGA